MSDSMTPAPPAIRIFDRLMRGYTGSAALRLWNNTLHSPTGESPTFTMVVRDPAVLRWLVLDRNPIRLADAYFRGNLDFEGDLYSAIALKTHFERLSLSWRDKLELLRDARHLPNPRIPTRRRQVASATHARRSVCAKSSPYCTVMTS